MLSFSPTRDKQCQSLEIYSHLAIVGAQRQYNEVIGKFPV
jgi:hypothetical protein